MEKDTQEASNFLIVPDDDDEIDEATSSEDEKAAAPKEDSWRSKLIEAWEDTVDGKDTSEELAEVYAEHKQELEQFGLSAAEYARASKTLIQLANQDPQRCFRP